MDEPAQSMTPRRLPHGAHVQPWRAGRPPDAGASRVWKSGSRKELLFKNPMLGGRAQLFESLLRARFGVDTYHRLGSRQAVADPRSVAEDEFQPVSTDDL